MARRGRGVSLAGRNPSVSMPRNLAKIIAEHTKRRALRKKGKGVFLAGKGVSLAGSGVFLAGKGKKRKRKSGNPWIAHVKKWRKNHPGVSYAVALKRAKKSYRKRR